MSSKAKGIGGYIIRQQYSIDMPRNVVFICLDSVRLDYFNKYAPRLRNLADIEFSECRAVSSWSVPSHGSFMTGDLPSIHGSHAFNQSYDHLSHSDTFLSEFSEHVSLGLSANPYASPDFGFDEFFDIFIATRPGKYLPDGMSVDSFGWEYDESGLQLYLAFIREALRHENPGASLANGIIQKSRNVLKSGPIPRMFDDGAKPISQRLAQEVKDAEQPIFVFANFMEAHEPMEDTLRYSRDLYDTPRGWSSGKIDEPDSNKLDKSFIQRYRNLYSAAIDYLDRQISTLVEKLLTEGNTTVIITADHGDNLGYKTEDRMFGHVGSLSEGLLHVPLIIINPPDHAPSGTIDEYVSHLDLPDLLISLANDQWVDISTDIFVAELIGDTGWIDGTATERSSEFWGRTIRTVYRGSTKIEWDSLGDAYRIEFGESPSSRISKDVIDEPPTWATREFVDSINDARNAALDAGDEARIPESVKMRLEDLGYR